MPLRRLRPWTILRNRITPRYLYGDSLRGSPGTHRVPRPLIPSRPSPPIECLPIRGPSARLLLTSVRTYPLRRLPSLLRTCTDALRPLNTPDDVSHQVQPRDPGLAPDYTETKANSLECCDLIAGIFESWASRSFALVSLDQVPWTLA